MSAGSGSISASLFPRRRHGVALPILVSFTEGFPGVGCGSWMELRVGGVERGGFPDLFNDTDTLHDGPTETTAYEMMMGI